MAQLMGRLHSLASLYSGSAAREGYLSAIDQGVISIANFAATIILARVVSPTELGMYGVGFTILRLARAIQDGLVVQPVNVYGAVMETDVFKRYASSSAILQVAIAVICALAAALTGWVLILNGQDTAGPALFFTWFAMLWWLMQEYIRRVLYTRGRVLQAVINTGVANAIRLALMVWWVKQGTLSGVRGLDAIGWGALAALIPGLWLTRQYWTVKIYPLKAISIQFWSFGRWVLGSSIASWIAVEFYPVLTAGMISFAAAGAYRALQNLVAPILTLLRAVDTFMTPRAARVFEAGGRPALSRTMRQIYLASGIPILGLCALSVVFRDQLLHLLYGDTYLQYSNGMVLMAVFYGLLFAYWPVQIALKALRRSRPLFIANIAATIAMFTVGVYLIQQWGVYGTLAGQALNALLITLILWGSWNLSASSPGAPTTGAGDHSTPAASGTRTQPEKPGTPA